MKYEKIFGERPPGMPESDVDIVALVRPSTLPIEEALADLAVENGVFVDVLPDSPNGRPVLLDPNEVDVHGEQASAVFYALREHVDRRTIARILGTAVEALR